MNLMFRVFSFQLLVLGSILLTGCGDAQMNASNSAADQGDHDHETDGDGHTHAHPESLAEALAEVAEICAKVQTASAAGDMEIAHGPVHAIGHLLEQIPQLADKESLSETDRQQLDQAVDSLMGSFGALDERLHGGDTAGKSYSEVASEVDGALAKLKAIKLPEDQP